MAFIDVHIQMGDFPSSHDRSIRKKLSENLIDDSFWRLDHPSPNADVITREFICTSTAIRKTVMKKREVVARLIAEALTAEILESVEFADTEMGYTKIQRG